MPHNRCLILFVKYPQKGKVKTRLAYDLGEKFVTDLYMNFLLDTLQTVEHGNYNLRIFFHPPEKEKEIEKLCGNNHRYYPQIGRDLGEKMKNSFITCFAEGFDSAIIIGTDCPDLPQSIIDDAFAALDDHNDVVIGPAIDGGYYLIGLKKNIFSPEIFSGLAWGTPAVLKQTMDILQASALRTKIIQKWRDIDTREDLLKLIDKNKKTKFVNSQTMAFLKKNKISSAVDDYSGN
jgi:uncharacterized protein